MKFTQDTESKKEDKVENGEEPDDALATMSSQSDGFSQGIAQLIEYVMTHKEKMPSVTQAMLSILKK